MSAVIDLPQALDLLRQARDERGAPYRYADDFTGACAYTAIPQEADELAAACLIGVALSRAGGPVATLQELDGSISALAGFEFGQTFDEDAVPRADDLDSFIHAELLDTGESELLGTVDVELTEKAARVWLAAQRQQENGHTWGEAVAFAEQVAERLESVTLTRPEVVE
jgi:hypothetical protein